MALSFGIGAVKKTAARGRKTTTTSKTKAKTTRAKATAKKAAPKARGAKPTAGSKVSKTGNRYYPSTPKSKKGYTASLTCQRAGTELRATGSSRAGAVLALCKASVQSKKIKPAALKKARVQLRRLSTK
jgi:hypothetical protein